MFTNKKRTRKKRKRKYHGIQETKNLHVIRLRSANSRKLIYKSSRLHSIFEMQNHNQPPILIYINNQRQYISTQRIASHGVASRETRMQQRSHPISLMDHGEEEPCAAGCFASRITKLSISRFDISGSQHRTRRALRTNA